MNPNVPVNPIEEAALKLAGGICPGCIYCDKSRAELSSNGALAERACHKFNLENFYYDERLHKFWCRHRSESDVVSARLAESICPGCTYFDENCASICKSGELLTERPCPHYKLGNFYYDKRLKKFWCNNWKNTDVKG